MVGIKGKSGKYKHSSPTQITKDRIRLGCKNAIVIHHINGNHFDDRPENRMVVTPKEHVMIHMLQGDIHIFKKGYHPETEFKKGHIYLEKKQKGG